MNLDQLNKATKIENNDVAFDFDKRIEEFIKTERVDNPELYTTTTTTKKK
jgi:hypothetical protein